MRPFLFPFAIIAAILGVVGYLTTRREVDVKKADAIVKEWVEGSFEPVKKVDCPEGKMKPGSELLCVVTFESGKAYTAKITFGDHDNYTIQFVTPIVSAEKLAAKIVAVSKAASNAALGLELECGKGIIEIPPDGILCSARNGVVRGHVRVRTIGNGVTWAAEP